MFDNEISSTQKINLYEGTATFGKRYFSILIMNLYEDMSLTKRSFSILKINFLRR
jgi:hypothetical protein